MMTRANADRGQLADIAGCRGLDGVVFAGIRQTTQKGRNEDRTATTENTKVNAASPKRSHSYSPGASVRRRTASPITIREHPISLASSSIVSPLHRSDCIAAMLALARRWSCGVVRCRVLVMLRSRELAGSHGERERERERARVSSSSSPRSSLRLGLDDSVTAGDNAGKRRASPRRCAMGGRLIFNHPSGTSPYVDVGGSSGRSEAFRSSSKPQEPHR